MRRREGTNKKIVLYHVHLFRKELNFYGWARATSTDFRVTWWMCMRNRQKTRRIKIFTVFVAKARKRCRRII